MTKNGIRNGMINPCEIPFTAPVKENLPITFPLFSRFHSPRCSRNFIGSKNKTPAPLAAAATRNAFRALNSPATSKPAAPISPLKKVKSEKQNVRLPIVVKSAITAFWIGCAAPPTLPAAREPVAEKPPSITAANRIGSLPEVKASNAPAGRRVPASTRVPLRPQRSVKKPNSNANPAVPNAAAV